MGEQQENSQKYFNKAIFIWSPQQIERVLKAMNCD
jgi:hypothetical protein